MRWCDVLRVKAEFPIKLWPYAALAYHGWVRESIRRNVPYDDFARELLTASGSNFRKPQVNFYRAVQNREPSGVGLGRRFNVSRRANGRPGRRSGWRG
jgi:hypothetical protein